MSPNTSSPLDPRPSDDSSQEPKSLAGAHPSTPSSLPPSNFGPTTKIDRLIKGTPAEDSKAAKVATELVQQPSIPAVHLEGNAPATPQNPLDNHPTSPSTIYLNLLIMEASFRQQYQHLCLRRRKYTIFLILLCMWTGYFFNIVYIVGPSPYSLVSTFEKLALLGGVVTALLFWMTGQYAKRMLWPKKFIANTNKGLRIFNVKLVVVKGSFRHRFRDWLEILVKRHPLGLFYALGLKKLPPPRPIVPDHRRRSSTIPSIGRPGMPPMRGSLPGTPGTPPPLSAADIALAKRVQGNARVATPPPDLFDPEDYLHSGGDVKIVVLAKNFSTDFREGWEIYRNVYWQNENERRAKEVEAIKVSLRETGSLPPMNSQGVITSASVASIGVGGSAFPGISGRPVRKPSISSAASAVTSTRQHRTRGSVSTMDSDATIRGTSGSVGSMGAKQKPRIVRKKSGPLLHHESSTDDLGTDSPRGKTSSLNPNVRSVRRPQPRTTLTSSSAESLASSDDGSAA